MQTQLSSTPSISMMDLRKEPGTILDKVDYRNESFVIERAGKPKAVLIPIQDYEEVKRVKNQAKTRFFEIVDKVREKTKQFDPNDLQKAIDDAVMSIKPNQLER